MYVCVHKTKEINFYRMFVATRVALRLFYLGMSIFLEAFLFLVGLAVSSILSAHGVKWLCLRAFALTLQS